ncbi:hypothetical protein [Streptomyces eurythermus]
MKHNPRRCALCGTLRSGFVRMTVRNALPHPRASHDKGVGK